jgi:hypothetical protein
MEDSKGGEHGTHGTVRYSHRTLAEKGFFSRIQRRCERYVTTCLKETGYDYAYCVHLANGRDQWWTVVQAAMNCRYHRIGNFLTS